MNKILKFTLCIILPLSLGGLSGLSTVAGINTWYIYLNKPFFNPPNYLFGPVWTVLYLLMGISFYLILESTQKEALKKAIFIFSLQLFLNFCWSFLFFFFHQVGLALIEIIVIWLSIVAMIRVFYTVNKTAALLQFPYLLWVSFATALNAAIWVLN